jgi:hypothetical protein
MQFCPKCNNILDISRTAPKSVTTLDTDTPTSVSNSSDNKEAAKIIKKYLGGSEIEYDDVKTLGIENLIKSNEYTSLKQAEKDKLLKIVNDLVGDTDDSTSAYKVCKNCWYYEHIMNKTMVISRMNSSTTSGYSDTSRYTYMRFDKSLPHTREYICKNDKCDSHTDHSKRDAVWYRPVTNSYMTYYTCVACGSHWIAS